MEEVISISVLGAGLVFLGLTLLWFMMDGLVRLTTNKNSVNRSIDVEKDNTQDKAESNKHKAAAVAVSVALQNAPFLSQEHSPNSQQTPWQIVHRYSQLHNLPQQSDVSKRKME